MRSISGPGWVPASVSTESARRSRRCPIRHRRCALWSTRAGYSNQGINGMFGMRFDLRVPGMTAAQIAKEYRTAIEMAQWADEKGALNIGLSEHHCSEDGY